MGKPGRLVSGGRLLGVIENLSGLFEGNRSVPITVAGVLTEPQTARRAEIVTGG